jgi:hypothetical protein
LFADTPQLVFRVDFVEPVDHPDQRASFSSRFTAGAFEFFILSQSGERPER